jgi:hypothetical protein
MVVSDRLTYADLFAALEDAAAQLGRKVAPTIYSSKASMQCEARNKWWATFHAARMTRPAPETASGSGRDPLRMIDWPRMAGGIRESELTDPHDGRRPGVGIPG